MNDHFCLSELELDFCHFQPNECWLIYTRNRGSRARIQPVSLAMLYISGRLQGLMKQAHWGSMCMRGWGLEGRIMRLDTWRLMVSPKKSPLRSEDDSLSLCPYTGWGGGHPERTRRQSVETQHRYRRKRIFRGRVRGPAFFGPGSGPHYRVRMCKTQSYVPIDFVHWLLWDSHGRAYIISEKNACRAVRAEEGTSFR